MNQKTKLGTRIPLSALTHAVTVAEYSSFRRAAEHLGIVQSSISTRVKQLEEELGIMLFERLPRGVRMTEAGNHFLAQITEGIDLINHAITTASGIAKGETGSLRIGLYSPIYSGFLSRILHNFRAQHPSIGLHFTEGHARSIIKSVREQVLDVAFVLSSPPIKDCHSKPLWSDQLMIAIPKSHRLLGTKKIHWSDLSEEKFIIQKNGIGPQFYDLVVMRLNRISYKPFIELIDVGRDTLLGMVAKGYGITPVSSTVATFEFPGLTFLPLTDEPDPLIFSAVWSVHNRSATLRNMLSLAQAETRLSISKSPDNTNLRE